MCPKNVVSHEMRTHKYLRPMNAYTTQVRLFILSNGYCPSTVVYAPEAASARSIEETCSPTIDLEVLFRVRNLQRRLTIYAPYKVPEVGFRRPLYRMVPFTVDVVGSINSGTEGRCRLSCSIVMRDHCLIPWTHSRAIWLIRRRSATASCHSCKL